MLVGGWCLPPSNRARLVFSQTLSEMVTSAVRRFDTSNYMTGAEQRHEQGRSTALPQRDFLGIISIHEVRV